MNKEDFKPGHKVRVVRSGGCHSVGIKGTLEFNEEYKIHLNHKGKRCNCYETWELINDTPMTNITEKFALVFKSEPYKSFRKAGITNGDDLLTSEGQTIFLGWLLEQNKEKFKTDVVDPILAEQKEDKC